MIARDYNAVSAFRFCQRGQKRVVNILRLHARRSVVKNISGCQKDVNFFSINQLFKPVKKFSKFIKSFALFHAPSDMPV